VKKPVDFNKAVKENKARFVEALPYIAGSRKPRSKPRSAEESIGMTIATAEIVQNAYKTGRLVKKTPKGFELK
jgi:hypothetical protein